MSKGKEKAVQVKVPEELYMEAKMKLLKRGLSWQDLLLNRIESFVKGKKKKK